MSKSDFPLSKGHSFRLGTGWEWCVQHLRGAGREMRLLIAYHQGKQEYLAWLGVVEGTDQKLIARLEYHASHAGWHVHLKPEGLKNVAPGVVKQQRERFRLCGAETEAAVTRIDAVMIAHRLFNVEPQIFGTA